MPLRVLQSLEERGARDGDGHVANQHLRFGVEFLVGAPVLALLLPLVLLAPSLLVVLVHGLPPKVDDVLADALARGLLTDDDAHQSKPLLTAVAIAEGDVVGIGGSHRQQGTEGGHPHLLGNSREALFQTGDGRNGGLAVRRVSGCGFGWLFRFFLVLIFLLLRELGELFGACVDALHGG